MSIPSLIFWGIFVVPLLSAMIWIITKDKKSRIVGFVVMGVVLLLALLAVNFLIPKNQ